MLHAVFGDPERSELPLVRFSPASVTRIAIEAGKPELLALNDIAHLGEKL
jgi:hypothetical protein